MKKTFALLLLIIIVTSCKTKTAIITTESLYFTDSIYSKYLKEYRKQTIYLPKNFDPNNNYPLVYAINDEKNIIPKKNILDSLINNNIIKPLIFITSYSNNKNADSIFTKNSAGKKVFLKYRHLDYTNFNSIVKDNKLLANRFENHMNYFENELIKQNEKFLEIKINKQNRYFIGTSNSSGFGISLLNRYPDLIETYLCFSPLYAQSIKNYKWNLNIKYPNLYIVYEDLEPTPLKEQRGYLIEEYNKFNSFIEVNSFKGGLEYKIWEKEIINYLIKLFPTKK